ncbi:hypothetical protein [Methylobacterium aerolatum]|uniref:Uncharacterized protein n=1 Tax=Methylobacterium aerolatum TaxID=418708 RepID=A0ABU0I0X5_9HYPH|nr:hypothetical protein [Methylobacterium aerolatum]MDQ0448249.1 hypothetical protein [Methylobacterium aerolatum]
MTPEANEARHLDLVRFEHAAGAAFGYEADDDRTPARFAVAPAAFAVATFATAVAATLTYLI